MSLSLFVLSLASFALVAFGLSAVMGAALPWLSGLSAKAPPRSRGALLLAMAFAPAGLAGVVLLVSLFAVATPGADHCLRAIHDHPHLCQIHASLPPGLLLFGLAFLMGLRALSILFDSARAAHVSRRTSRQLAEASDESAGVRVFVSEAPGAFVLGALRPRVHVSTALLEMGEEIVAPVLAHERAHARHRDLFWRAVFPWIALGHLPRVADELRAQLVTAQEMAADEAAASELGDPLRVADALVKLARLDFTVPATALGFAHGDVRARVLALLSPRSVTSPWHVRHVRLLIGACGAATILAILVADHSVHHGLEILLGALS